MRVQIVKNHYVTKGNYTAAGFFDGSLEEKAKKYGDETVKQLINKGLVGSSVTCVLIGNETFTRRWVQYEIFKSIELGMGVFGIRIHQIPHPQLGRDYSGPNPFDYLGYGTSTNLLEGDKLRPMIYHQGSWKNAPHLQMISRTAAPYIHRSGAPILGTIFNVYDWVSDDGYRNFASWVEKAAAQANRQTLGKILGLP